MRIKIVNLVYREEAYVFDQQQLEKFQEENDIEILKAELVQKPEALFWSLVISYTPRKKMLTDAELRVGEFLKRWRYEKAQKEGVAAFIILTNKQIDEIVKMKPTNRSELLKVRGFSEKKFAQYGEEIISMFSREFVVE